MTFQVSTSLVALAAVAFTAAPMGKGHVHQQFPISRQYAWSPDFYDYSFENVESRPFAFNAGSTHDIRDRARAETDPDELDANGGGSKFPLYFQPRADNGNYLESNEIAKRHGVCGDPRLGRTQNIYSTPNSEWEVLDTFVSGQEIEIDAVMVYYHWGHFEFFICDTADLDSDDVVTQECLNKYPLTRAPDANAASPVDPNYSGRYYTDPPCRKDETEQTVSGWVPDGAYNIRMRYLLPDITCEHCVLQMHYMSGDRCRHIGVDEFNPSSWNSECAPAKEDWIDTTHFSICGEGESYPEEFWACSDFAIVSSGSDPAPSPVPAPTPEPTPTTETKTYPSPTPEPYTPPTPEPYTEEETGEPEENVETCSNGIPGIEGSNDGGSVCCPLECGQCGTQGCHQAGLEVDLDHSYCCVSGVLDYQDRCSDSGEAPCIISGGSEETAPSPTPDSMKEMTYGETCTDGIPGIKGSNDKGSVCCPLECGQCGTSGCHQAGVDADLDNTYCCVSGVLDTYGPCSDSGEAPCIISGAYEVMYATATVAGLPEIEGATFLGCLEDVGAEEAMTIGFVNDETMTNEECVEYCKMQGHAYAGTQNNEVCWCGSSDDMLDGHAESVESVECDKVCGGDKAQVCGGTLAATTWATGLEPEY